METTNQPTPPDVTGVPSSSDWFASWCAPLAEYVTPDEIEKTKRIFETGNASKEVLFMATALRGLVEACEEAAQFCRDDDRDLTAETWDQRAGNYRTCYTTLVEQFDGDLTAEANAKMCNPAPSNQPDQS